MKRFIYQSDNYALTELLEEHFEMKVKDTIIERYAANGHYPITRIIYADSCEEIYNWVKENAYGVAGDYRLTDIDIRDLAEEYGLDTIETTTDGNGYPKSLKFAAIGFNTFEEAEAFASAFDLRVTTFHKRDGWMLWSRDNSTTYEPMRITSADYGDNYNHYYGGLGAAENYFRHDFRHLLPNAESFEEVEEMIRNAREIADELDLIDDDQLVITCEGNYIETIDTALMQWSHDTHTYAIGVIDD